MAAHPATERLGEWQRRALIAGGAAVALSLTGMFLAREQFFRAWLMAYLFWAGLGLGCMGILLLHNVTGGGWGVGIRRLLESGTRTLPLMALLFVPIVFGLKDLYIWARPEVVAGDEILRHKSAYLNVPFLLARTAVYLLVWVLVSLRLSGWSLLQDVEKSRPLARRLRAFSGPGIAIYFITMTFASIDWIMSLEPHWFSTIYGMLTVVGQVLSAFAFIIAVTILLSREKPMSGVVSPGAIYDLGNLLFAFVLLWAYLAFSQFLIIWAGNLPEEIPWYLRRLTGGWQFVGLLVVLFHFALPFIMLVNRGTKRNPRLLALVALMLVFMRLVDLFWVVSPASDVASVFRIHWLHLAAPLGIGGLWLAMFLHQLKGRWHVEPMDMHTPEASHGGT